MKLFKGIITIVLGWTIFNKVVDKALDHLADEISKVNLKNIY